MKVGELRGTIEKPQDHIAKLVKMTFGRASEWVEGPTLFDDVVDEPVAPLPPPAIPEPKVRVLKRKGHGRRPKPADVTNLLPDAWAKRRLPAKNRPPWLATTHNLNTRPITARGRLRHCRGFRGSGPLPDEVFVTALWNHRHRGNLLGCNRPPRSLID